MTTEMSINTSQTMVRERSVIPVSSVLGMSHSHHQRQSDNYLFDLWLPFISAVRMMQTYLKKTCGMGLTNPAGPHQSHTNLLESSQPGGRGTSPIQSLRRNNLVVISQFPWRRGERISLSSSLLSHLSIISSTQISLHLVLINIKSLSIIFLVIWF